MSEYPNEYPEAPYGYCSKCGYPLGVWETHLIYPEGKYTRIGCCNCGGGTYLTQETEEDTQP